MSTAVRVFRLFVRTSLPPAAFPSCFGLVLGRFEAPLEPLQVLTWVLLLLIAGGFYSLIIPGLSAPWSIVAGVIYGVMASSTVVAGVIACLKDPMDPNVRRFHEVRCGRVYMAVIC